MSTRAIGRLNSDHGAALAGAVPPEAPDSLHITAAQATIERAAAIAGDYPIRVPVRHNEVLSELVGRINADVELHALWRAANVNAVDRLGMSDHGRVHVQIVANIALKLFRMLVEAGVEPGIVRDHGLTVQDAEVIVVLSAVTHDLGIAVHRDGHEDHSLVVAGPKLKELLSGLYSPATATIVWAETMHSIISHRRESKPLTLEAGVLKVADALDMARGRSRIPFEAGQVNIHSLSAAAIERVEIQRGESRPIQIRVVMNNSAGIFQVDELLKGKLERSGIAQYFEVVAISAAETEQRLVEVFRY